MGCRALAIFVGFFNDLDDLLLKKEKEPLPTKLGRALGPQRTTTALQFISYLNTYPKHF